jgi:hypothetical protein
MWKNVGNKQKGYIPEVGTLLHKYKLDIYLDKYIEEGIFPDKRQWKSVVENAVQTYVTIQEQELISNDAEMYFYKCMCFTNSPQCQLYDNSKMHVIWRLIPVFRSLSLQLIVLASLCTYKHCQQYLECEYCNFQYNNLVVHFMTSCSKYATARQVFWNLLVDKVSVSCSAYFNRLSDEDFISLLLRK